MPADRNRSKLRADGSRRRTSRSPQVVFKLAVQGAVSFVEATAARQRLKSHFMGKSPV